MIHLEWGPAVRVEPVRPSERVAALIRQSVVRPGAEAATAYLDLATLPTWRFVRPHGLDGLDGGNAQLLDALG